ncbi:MAG: LptE family protein [Candidatus Marinimicrobia bacterium]|nr:LptE family protein [Candidatus Neomarinimicrobiota bacterium]
MITKTIKTVFSLLIVLMLVTGSGCWLYSFKGTLPPHIKNIAIPLFSDRTAEFNIQQSVTDQIRIGFIKENILKLVEEGNAHSVLYGSIQSIQDRPLVYTGDETGEAVTEYRLTLKIEAEWYDKVEDKAVFKKTFTAYSEYDPTGATDRTRTLALTEAVDQITEDIVNQILSGW